VLGKVDDDKVIRGMLRLSWVLQPLARPVED